ncbi:MAG: hypothetical protein AB7T07_11650 [Steroidobacteraceae bacterium]
MTSAIVANAPLNTLQRERVTPQAEPQPRVRLESGREEVLLKLDLSDLVLPKVHDLHVDGLKRSWWSRLFGKH